MAHIADFMVETRTTLGLNNYIAREVSSSPLYDGATRGITPANQKEPHVWRMHQPSESRRYHLFPGKDKLSIPAGRKSPDAETVLSSTLGHIDKDRPVMGIAIRTKPKDQFLIRRKKVNVPDLGTMTTVQEIAMDSPTIPGRPPVHERSISAPGNSWRQQMFGGSLLSFVSVPALDENEESTISNTISVANAESSQKGTIRQGSPKQPLSPKILAPLFIPSASVPHAQLPVRKSSLTRLRSGSTPPEVPPKSARMMGGSPYGRSTSTTSMSASTTSLPIFNSPILVSDAPNSAPGGRSSPKPWSAGPLPNPDYLGHIRGQSETISRQGPTMGHCRGESETSVMDRGRPMKRTDGSLIKRKSIKPVEATVEELKDFETLPLGYRPLEEASSSLPCTEIENLREQAVEQASRFKVLSSKDVENLSRELRGLDERCDYLRKTHRSLRSGRRSLHDRICSYLRSPRVARFSHESILKQEEALSELDTSIDDWVFKLEQAENKRTRVRQKLLEHVAAALILPPSPSDDGARSNGKANVERQISTGPMGENTPPRSPVKSHSPQRFAAPLQVDSPAQLGRMSLESIRIYADSGVDALFADVEEEITRMSRQAKLPSKAPAQAEFEPSDEASIQAGIILKAAKFSPPNPANTSAV